MIDIKLINLSENPNPEYATDGASGFDIRSNKFYILKPKTVEIIPTGLYFEIPDNLEIQIRPRSGLAAKYGVTVLNTPGTIDSDYRGEIKVILINHSDDDFIIHIGDRIAQGVLSAVDYKKRDINFVNVNELGDTSRASGGFGSTGVK